MNEVISSAPVRIQIGKGPLITGSIRVQDPTCLASLRPATVDEICYLSGFSSLPSEMVDQRFSFLFSLLRPLGRLDLLVPDGPALASALDAAMRRDDASEVRQYETAMVGMCTWFWEADLVRRLRAAGFEREERLKDVNGLHMIAFKP